ncbi:unnamed protein product, partial [Ascophyllum nodosum]
MTADGSDDNLINLEGVERGTYSFMDVDTTPEPLEDVLPISPAPADEENSPGSRNEDESETEEEGILLRLGMGWFRGVITREVQARTSDRYDFRVFLETDGSTRSVKLPLAKKSWIGPRQRDLGRCYCATPTSTLQRTARARARTSSRTMW